MRSIQDVLFEDVQKAEERPVEQNVHAPTSLCNANERQGFDTTNKGHAKDSVCRPRDATPLKVPASVAS